MTNTTESPTGRPPADKIYVGDSFCVFPIKFQYFNIGIGQAVNIPNRDYFLSLPVGYVGLSGSAIKLTEKQSGKSGLFQPKRKSSTPRKEINAVERFLSFCVGVVFFHGGLPYGVARLGAACRDEDAVLRMTGPAG